MQHRIRDILLISSPYDLYLFEEDGRLYDLIRQEFQELHMTHSPEITRVSSANEALALATEDKGFDLIITTLHIEELSATKLARLIKTERPEIPIVLLAYDARELKDLMMHHDTSVFDHVFIWQGDFRLLIAIIKNIEDHFNVDVDTRSVGVQSIILIEDNVRYYSSFLPIIYTEILNQSRRLISEGVNLTHKFLRMRARPKILLCTNYEEAMNYLDLYEENILGIVSDIDFKRQGKQDQRAGLEFAMEVKRRQFDIPVLLQSTTAKHQEEAEAIGAAFCLKDSPTLLYEVRQFMTQYFSFGDFIFRAADGNEVARAYDLHSLEEHLQKVPAETVRYHSERNHFSNWLKARTEFWLAHELRPRKVEDYPDVEALREDLIASLKEYRKQRQRGQVTDFSKETFDPYASFARIGGGSLGGKARGLGFVNILLHNLETQDKFKDVRVFVPPGVVLGTDVFDEFLEQNALRNFALNCHDDREIRIRFLEAERFPEHVVKALSDYLSIVHEPLAVRSSSLLEDSQYHPFAGVYETHMIPNAQEELAVRLTELLNAVKLVYASTFYQGSKDYMKATAYRPEEEKMAVIIQRMVGSLHEHRFYPDFAGVAKSHNFYPLPPQKSEDGIAAVALGLGKTIVEGGITVRFSPKYPSHVLQFSSPAEALKNNQTEFYALEMNETSPDFKNSPDPFLKKFNISIAENDGVLNHLASTFSPENDKIDTGISRPGVRIITFAPILEDNHFPLASIVDYLLEVGTWGMGSPVELEFAVNMHMEDGRQSEFSLLQMRPLALSKETEELDIDEESPDDFLCQSTQVLGNGVLDDIFDIVYVDIEKFDRSKSREVARELMQFNGQLLSERRPYLLIGVGRWGTFDPWLGIPVKWEHISGAKAIVEGNFKDIDVQPSQGSHFFQNITSFMIGYFSVDSKVRYNTIDWDWLRRQKPIRQTDSLRHLRFKHPVIIKMNGRLNKGIIMKPKG